MRTRKRTATSPYFSDVKRSGEAKLEDSEVDSIEEAKAKKNLTRKRRIKEETNEGVAVRQPSDEVNGSSLSDGKRRKGQCSRKSSAGVGGGKPSGRAKKGKRTLKQRKAESVVDGALSDGSSSEWEDVESVDSIRPSTSGNVELVMKSHHTKEENKKHCSLIRRYLNGIVKARRENRHQVLLLCFLAHGRYLSKCCSDTLTVGLALSMLPAAVALSDSLLEHTLLVRLVRWFRKKYVISSSDLAVGSDPLNTKENLRRMISNCTVNSRREHTMVFISMARSLGMEVRLIVSLNSNFLLFTDDSEANSSTDGPSLLRTVLDKLDSPKKGKNKDMANDVNQTSPPKECASLSMSQSAAYFEYWPEVYLPSQEKWHCVNLFSTGPLYSWEPLDILCSDEVAYCVSFDNEHLVKDLTLRYATNAAMLKYRQWRIVDSWWNVVLNLFKPKDTSRDSAENEEIERQLIDRPLPRKISEYKNHPLYVLERDLLKFQALYPKDIQPIGYCSSVPVYRRSAVCQLNGKEAWIREARVIKENEEPYKIVKARPKMNVPPEERVDRPLLLYGIWQTEPYVPPTAKDGVVPRNKFGNVELYQMNMLPKGTVYLNVPGLLEVARKLEIDCVPAVVGWEFHCRSSHPILKGFVVCEEFKDVLMEAWKQERIISVQKERERKSKRAIRNWRRLVRGLLIKSNLAKHFPVTDKVVEAVSPSTSCTQPAAWPQCRQDFVFEGSLSD
uniref:Rad4 beta-hairpin domain-containing protein n=1 Tax=Trichuris muris TaxID=70415 RepID=A0A5S6QWD8_TRIMR